MAINKNVENEYGMQFAYHKIREVRVINDDNVGVQLVMTVYSWLNKEARINGKEPIIQNCIINKADFAMTPFYALLKAKFPDYSNGIDDYDNSFKTVPEGTPEFFEQTKTGKLIKRWKEQAAAESEPEADNETDENMEAK